MLGIPAAKYTHNRNFSKTKANIVSLLSAATLHGRPLWSPATETPLVLERTAITKSDQNRGKPFCAAVDLKSRDGVSHRDPFDDHSQGMACFKVSRDAFAGARAKKPSGKIRRCELKKRTQDVAEPANATSVTEVDTIAPRAAA
ncbi:MAG: hypothetical protein H6905_09550 [Hyphomicrobiales bacterium]|nr:hypothetical protein [Hyphomicrobiales bacterium]